MDEMGSNGKVVALYYVHGALTLMTWCALCPMVP